MNKITDPLTFTVPLSFAAHALAQRLARQSRPQRAKLTYLNILAVSAVETYLRCLGFEINAERSDSRNSIALKFLDVADLWVEQIGSIECRPVLSEERTCSIPLEAREDRVAYVAVQLHPSLREATLIGFTETAAAEISLEKLRSLSEFPQYLDSLRQPAPAAQLSIPPAVQNLRRWLEGAIDAGWEMMETSMGRSPLKLIPTRNLFQTQKSLKRAKLIDLGMQLGQEEVVLALAIAPNEDGTIKVGIQVYPSRERVYLPPALQLIMLDDSGKILQQVKSGNYYNYIKLREFKGQKGDLFSLKIALNQVEVHEGFVL